MRSDIYISKCKSYNKEEVARGVRNFFQHSEPLLKSFIEKGSVLLKPNLCIAQPPERAITTNPVIIEEVVEYLHGKDVEVTIGENPIGQASEQFMDKLWKVTGIEEIVKRTGCKLSDLSKNGYEKFTINTKGFEHTILISKEYLDAKAVINMPKFKTHSLMGLTGAIKNLFGVVPGRLKGHIHTLAPEKKEFAKILVDIFSIRLPELTIMDAIVGLEGDGPTTGGVPRNIGTLIFSEDTVLVDSISTQMMGMNPADNQIVAEASARKLGMLKPNEVIEDGFEKEITLTLDNFKLPASVSGSNDEIVRRYFNLSRLIISFNKEKCTSCLECLENCPVNAITYKNSFLELEESKCIQCLCCHEVCPSAAIQLKKNEFYQALKKLKKTNKN